MVRQPSVGERVAQLRAARAAEQREGLVGARGAAALGSMARLWADRVRGGWLPPVGSTYPWPMVRVSLEGLLPGLEASGDWLARARAGITPSEREGARGPAVVAHVLAGNTPLLAWPGLAACLLAGSASFVKMSRGETLWPRLFVESLAEVDPGLAPLIHLDVWPGDGPRTGELVTAADAVIAYGSDAGLAAVRAATPADRLFLGYGHALSIGLVLAGGAGDDEAPGSEGAAASGFARDVLLYGQGGCLSPHAIFVEGDGGRAMRFGEALAGALAAEVEALEVPPVTEEGKALAVRRARDLALFSPGVSMRGDPALRWTVVLCGAPTAMGMPAGHGVVFVIPIEDATRDLGTALGETRGRISAAGVAGPLRDAVRSTLLQEGVSRICEPGTMQAPPLDWPNGGRDLLECLLRGTRIGA